ncbi:MAG: response regulator [Actinomycetota bacterium]|nr:response regulator [Actinomycetota bacterium]
MATVLVVDDERDLCELVRINLELDGHAVVVAHDGDAALALVRAARPDLVVLDVMMPGRDGFSVLQEIKDDAAVARTPVIMLTARTDVVDRLKGGIEGAVSYLTKPFSVLGLRAAVRDLLAGEDEPVVRRRVQRESLAELARLEAGRVGPAGVTAGVPARPHLTRLEPVGGGGAPRPAAPRPAFERWRSLLSDRQREILEAVLAAPSLPAAADSLEVSRGYLYASLRRMARKLGSASGPELVRTLRADGRDEST